MRRALFPLIAVAVVAVVVIGLSQASSNQTGALPKPYSIRAALRQLDGAPAPLAALHAQHSQLLGGGQSAFTARLKALRGYPIVVNKWGSWCNPCQREFTTFQRVSARKGKTVAFLGIDGGDNNGRARKFLTERPVSYPSYTDPKESLARSVQAGGPYPITIFIDRNGKVVIPHAGPYDSVKALEADIKRYLRA